MKHFWSVKSMTMPNFAIDDYAEAGYVPDMVDAFEIISQWHLE